MATGYLPRIFHFRFWFLEVALKCFLSIAIFIFTLSFLNSFSFAAEWYTVLGSGVLSFGDVVNNDIPSPPLPSGFINAVIQKPSLGEPSSFGTLVSSYEILSNSLGDSFVKNTKAPFVSYSFLSLIQNPSILEFNTAGDNCQKMLSNGLLRTDSIYKLTGANAANCFYQAVSQSGSNYNLSNDGLAILFVKANPATLVIDKNLIPLDSKKRLLVISDSTFSVAGAVGEDLISANFNSNPQLKLGLISLNGGGGSFVLEENGNKAFIFDGFIFGNRNLRLGRLFDFSKYPGGFYRFDPFYVAEMSKKGLSGLTMKGFLDSKVSWSYK